MERLYRIGEVSELFDLSNETLRNYERAGIISSEHVEGKRYRYYDIVTISKLIGIRSRRNEGFSIKELQRIYGGVSLGQYRTIVDGIVRRQERELERQKSYLDRMRRIASSIEEAEHRPNACVLEDSPDLYLLHYRKNNLLDSTGIERIRLTQWTRNLFWTQNFAEYKLDGSLAGTEEFNVALAVTPKDAELLEIDLAAPVRHHPSVPCVRCSCEREDISSPLENSGIAVDDFIRANRLVPCGNLFSLTVFGFHEDGRKRTFIDLYIPIRPK